MSENVINVSDQEFAKTVLESAQPVLVDFWAPWCAPCRMVGPFIEQIAQEYAGKLKVVKVNIDENPSTPSTYGVNSIPTLLIFKNGKPVQSNVGAMPYVQLKTFVDKQL